MKSLRQSLENLLKEDSGSESDKASCKKESVKSLIKTRMKRSSLSAHNYHFSQMWNIKDGPKMDQIEEKIETFNSAEIKQEHVLEAIQKLKAEGYSQ